MSTSGGSTWTSIDNSLDDGYAIALGSLYQAGSWYNPSAGEAQMAVFKTTNDGVTWDRVALSTERGYVSTVVVNPVNTSIAYAGGLYYDASYYTYSRLYKTTDGGNSWTQIGSSTFNTKSDKINGLCLDPSNPSKVLACTERGVYRSQDAGATWTPTTMTSPALCVAPDPGRADCYYIGTRQGVWESTDGGQTWQSINSGMDPRTILCITFDAENRRLYAGTEGDGVYRLDLSGSVVVAPQAPTLVSPAANATNVSVSPLFSWNASTGAVTYRLQVSTDLGFTALVHDDSTITGTSKQVGPLSNSRVYYWRVSAKNAGGTSPYSEVRGFTTIVAAPQVPVLASPADGALNIALTTILSWDASVGAATYHLQVSTTPSYTSYTVNDSTVTGTSKMVGPLSLGTTYYWRVRAINAGGASVFSASRQFKTIIALAVERWSEQIPLDFVLEKNYPNPFNPSTTIRFGLPRTSHVSLRIFNLLGEEVAVLVTMELPAGYYLTAWNAADLPSGVYICRLEAEELVKVGKLILLK